MSPTREQLHDLIERLPDDEIAVAQRFLLFLSQEPIGTEFANSIRRGIAQAGTGETITCHDCDEMVEKLLGKD
ncbi:MAG TPA: hypothetical protein VN841_16895 [Bryobacteraceae bacterium]|nr:hypothetical protein [Bryobacteraceae bacterium]